MNVDTKTAARRQIVDQYPCPGCGAGSGERCVTKSGQHTSAMHVLRRNVAVRKAGQGPCPAGCGDDLETVRNTVQHVRSGQFECDEETS